MTKWALINIEPNGLSATNKSITEIAIVLLENWQIIDL